MFPATYSGWGASTMTRGDAPPTGTQTAPTVAKLAPSVPSRTPGVRLVRFETPIAATPSEEPVAAFTGEGEVLVAPPSPLMSALPWVLGLGVLAAGGYALSRRKR